MDISGLVDILIGGLLAIGGWYLNGISSEVKRIDILLNRTREDYATRHELKEDMDRVMEALHRLEDKIDRVLTHTR
jgi:hypothetical protein